MCKVLPAKENFNPRSLAGATLRRQRLFPSWSISIHAPSRERPPDVPCTLRSVSISIHAPSRERPNFKMIFCFALKFQSTLPRGSDRFLQRVPAVAANFNPRSLAGATITLTRAGCISAISIHAPSRERLIFRFLILHHINFNPRSLAGATSDVDCNTV